MGATEFEECFHRHYPGLVAFAASATGDAETGHELAQEAFARLHRHWDRVAAYEQPGSWLRRVVTNLTIDRHRANAAERRAVSRLMALGTTLHGSIESDPWDHLISELPARHRAIVTLHYGEDMAVADIAELLDVSVNTVKSSLAKARDRLRSSSAVREHSGD